MIEVKRLSTNLLGRAESLFRSDPATSGCFCMWFIISVADYHAGGAERNKELFREMAHSSPHPIGLLAFQDAEPVGWCAVGPRERYDRALRIPSFKGRDPAEDSSVWLVPCFFITKGARRQGVAKALLQEAVALAEESGARAIEGFPFASGARLGKDPMVGSQVIFESCGFRETRRPSNTRVVMRRELNPQRSLGL